jgi:hypothetical protein
LSDDATPRLGLPYLAAGQAQKHVTLDEAGAWEAPPVQPGFLAWIADEQVLAVRTEAGWTALSSTFRNLTAALSPRGAATRFEIREQELTLAGGSMASTVVIPSRAVVLCVSTRTTQTVTGASGCSCGVAGKTGQLGSLLGAAA